MENALIRFVKKHSRFTLIEDKEILKFMRPPFMRFDSYAYLEHINNKNKEKMEKEDLIIGKEYCYSIIGNYSWSLRDGFIKRTESEAKQLVEKLKKAML